MLLGCLAALVIALPTSAQWQTFGNTISGSDWLGADFGSSIPLRIQTRANQPIDFSTANLLRARLNGNVTGPIGPSPATQFPNINRDGFLLLSGAPDAFTNTDSRAPFTRLHLVDPAGGSTDPLAYAQQHGFRPWQRNGITFTGNSDQAYIGQKYNGNDNTDFVIQ